MQRMSDNPKKDDKYYIYVQTKSEGFHLYPPVIEFLKLPLCMTNRVSAYLIFAHIIEI